MMIMMIMMIMIMIIIIIILNLFISQFDLLTLVIYFLIVNPSLPITNHLALARFLIVF